MSDDHDPLLLAGEEEGQQLPGLQERGGYMLRASSHEDYIGEVTTDLALDFFLSPHCKSAVLLAWLEI